MNTLIKTRSQTHAKPKATLRQFLVLGCTTLLMSSVVQAGWLDAQWMQGKTATQGGLNKQRVWQIREFSRIALVAREAGTETNQHPATVTPEALREHLAQIQVIDSNGARSLFEAEELADLARPLAQALGRAGPGEDVLLLSSAQRAINLSLSPTAVTARVFVQQGSLQIIVHDAHFEFYDVYRGANAAPDFIFGSRAAASGVSVQSAGAANQRTDWLSIPLQASKTSSATTPSAGSQTSPLSPKVGPGAGLPVDDIQRRLEVLKHLREKNLVTEDEYQHKRKEILQLL